MTGGRERRPLRGIWLGRRPYRPVMELMDRLAAARAEGSVPDTLLLLEHEPVVTLGRGADPAHVLLGEEALAARGFDCVRTPRGGDVTLHVPGQLVGYPIVDLAPDRCDVRRYVNDLTETMRRVAAGYGVSGGLLPGFVGLWVDRNAPGVFGPPGSALDLAKIGAIGVRVSRWITTHGFALNLANSADLYAMIVPCGIREHGVTSVRELTGTTPDVVESARRALEAFADVFDGDAARAGDPLLLEDASAGALSDLLPPTRMAAAF